MPFTNPFQVFDIQAVTESQFCCSNIIAAISAMIPITTHVIGFASSAAVNDHTEAIRPGSAWTPVTIACLAMPASPMTKLFADAAEAIILAPNTLSPSPAYIVTI